MRPPANAIDQAYLCAKAAQAERDGSGGTVIPTAHLEVALDTLDHQTSETSSVLEAALRAQFRKTVHRAIQSGECAVPLSVPEIQALATLVGRALEGAPSPDQGPYDNILPFPTPLPPPLDTYAEPA